MSIHPLRSLHLVTSSITSTPMTDTFPSSSPISRFQHSERLASASFSNSSPAIGGFDTIARTKTTRRKSSIGYFPPDSIGSPCRGSLTRRNSASSATQGHVKSRPRPPSPTSMKLEVDTSSGSPARVRQPITLMERNADLLRLIAQKESKCFELRSQLEMHEAELAELKRKWQKIVNKGLECGHRSMASADASTIVFDGIKEGVQGVSRLLSARFSYTPPPSSYPTVSTQPERCLPSLPNKYHYAKESNSSISTYMTSRSGSTPGRSSQSSMSSFGEDRTGAFEGNLCFEGEMMDDSHGNGESGVQVLMVRDTGATPTMSPNPEFHQQKQREAQEDCVSASLSTLRLNDANIECVKPNITGDFKKTCEIQATVIQAREAQLDLEQLDFSSLAPSVLLSRQSSNDMCTERSPQPRSSTSLSIVESRGSAPISSIPGFGLTAGVATISSPPVFSWMDNVGKKLKELHKSSTFTKNQKRASLFLSDMTNSAVNMLVASSTIAQEPPCSMPIDMAGKASDLQVAPASLNPKFSGSLLDDATKNETAKLGPAAAFQPVTPAPGLSKKIAVQAKKEETDEEEWNW